MKNRRLPALALAVDPPEADLMHRPPRSPRRGIFSRPVVTLMSVGGIWSTIVNLSLFGWVIVLIGDSEKVHNWHNMGMWIMIIFIITHVYVSLRADIISRQSSLSTIISGYRYYKDDRP